MKIGLSTKAFPANMTIPQGLRLAKRSGFDCVELDISEAGYLTLESDEKAVEFLRNSVENMSLEVGCVRADVLADHGPGSDYAGALRRCLEICSQFGADVMVAPFEGSEADVLAGALRGTSALGVRLGLEFCGGQWTHDSVAEFVDGLGLDLVGVCVDTGNSEIGDTPEDWIRTLGDRLIMLRARDFVRCPDGSMHVTNLLEGEVDWRSVRKALIEIGYDGLAVAQVPGYRHYGELGVKHCGEQMKRIFGAPAKGRE